MDLNQFNARPAGLTQFDKGPIETMQVRLSHIIDMLRAADEIACNVDQALNGPHPDPRPVSKSEPTISVAECLLVINNLSMQVTERLQRIHGSIG